jgi:hypothetical protein
MPGRLATSVPIAAGEGAGLGFAAYFCPRVPIMVTFCVEVSKWSDWLFEAELDLPFGASDIESFGRGSHKRQDLRFYARSDKGQ